MSTTDAPEQDTLNQDTPDTAPDEPLHEPTTVGEKLAERLKDHDEDPAPAEPDTPEDVEQPEADTPSGDSQDEDEDGVLAFLKAKGVQHSYQSDEEALSGLLEARGKVGELGQELGELRQWADFGRNVAPYWEKIQPHVDQVQQFIQQQSQAEQEQPKAWSPPIDAREYQRLQGQLERDEDGSVIGLAPGADPEALRKVRQYDEYHAEWQRRMREEPEEVLKPLVEPLIDQRFQAFTQQQQQMQAQAQAQARVQQQIGAFHEQHDSELFSDAGRTQMTPLGQQFFARAQWAAQQNMTFAPDVLLNAVKFEMQAAQTQAKAPSPNAAPSPPKRSSPKQREVKPKLPPGASLRDRMLAKAKVDGEL